MSNEFKVGVKLHVDSTQYTAEFTKAGQTAQAFAAQVSGSASSAATSVQSVTGKLDGLGQAATNGNAAAAAIDRITQSGRQAAGVLGAIPQRLTGAAAHFQAAQNGLAGVARQADAVKTALSGGTPAAQALGAATASASQQAAKAGGIAQAALGQTTISAKQTAAALRGVPAQFTDIFTSIQGGQAPLQVLLQQGGQLKDMFGGAVPAAKALGGYVLGLINPFTLAAGAAVVLGLAYYQGAKEADGYRAAILMSGNAAGTTVGQLSDMARAISAVTGTQGAAAAALTQMAASGAVARENLQRFTEVAMGLEKYVGQPIQATVGHLEQLGKAPLQASLKLNEQYHYLTVAVYEQIRALDEQGRKEEAAAAAQRAYIEEFDRRKTQIVQNLGYIERAWESATGAAKRGWDAFVGLGREASIDQKLATVRGELENRLARQGERPDSFDERGNEKLRQQIALLSEQQRLLRRGADAQAEGSKAIEREAEWSKIVNANKTKQAQQEAEIVRIRNAGKAAGKEQVEIEREIAAYRARVADKGGASAELKKETGAYQDLMAAIAAKLQTGQAELVQGGALSESQKLTIKLDADLAQGKLKLGAAHEASVRASIADLARQEQRQALQEGELKLAQQLAQARQDEVRGIEAYMQAQQDAAEKSLQSVQDRAASLEIEERAAALAAAQNITLAEAVERVAIARLREEQTGFNDIEGGRYREIEREIAAREKLLGVMGRKEAREALAKTADEAEKELKRVTEQYEQGLTNAAMQGGKSLKEYVHGMLRTTAFRILLDPVMRPLAGVLAGMTGSTAAQAAQGGGIMGTANLVSSAYSALTTGVDSSITAGFAKLAGSSFGQSIGLSNSAAIAGNNPSAYVPAGGQLTGLGSSIGTGLGMLGSGLAGYGISSAISGGYTTGGKTVNVLSGIASAFLGPIAGIVGGLINRAFGRKLEDTGLEGNLGGSAGFEGNSYQFYKGGWLRSDKTVRGELDAGVDKGLDTAVKQMQVSMAALAMSIQQPTEAISGFSQAIKLSFNGLDEAGIQEAIKEALAGYNEGLASAFIASVDRSELPSWVDRLMGNVDASAVERLQAVAEWPAKLLQSFGTSRDQLAQLYAQGLASGDATAAGEAVANSLVASIEASMLGNASAQVFDIVNQGIVTPLLDAMAMGQNVAQALSDASIQKTIERAKAVATAFAELWNNADFQSAMEDIRATVGSALGSAGAALQYTPRYTAAIADNTAATQAATQANNDAADAARRIAEERKGLQDEIDQLTMSRAGLLDKERAAIDASNRDLFDRLALLRDEKRIAEERTGIEQQWLQAIGATAQLREREIQAIDPANRALQQLVYRISDMQAASEAASAKVDSNYGVLQRSVDAEKKALAQSIEQTKEGLAEQADLARESIGKINSIFGAIQSAIKSTEVQSEELDRARRASALATLQGALAQAQVGGRVDKLPGIEQALGVLSRPSDQLFGRFDDYVRSQDEAADVMRQLGDQAGGQLGVAEMTLKATEDAAKALDKQYRLDVEALDQTLASWREQIDVSRGIDVSVLSVRDAVVQLAASLAESKRGGGGGGGGSAAPLHALAAYSPEQVVAGVDYVRAAAARGDVQAVYDGAKSAGLNVDQLVAVADLAGYRVGADEVRAWIEASHLQALPEASKKFATGGAFAGAGVVHRPTYFDMGQMGESGPEAILPLGNVGGRLGINAAGLIDSQSIVAAIAALQVQMELLIDAATATAVHTHDGKKATLELVDRGITVRTSATEPLDIAV